MNDYVKAHGGASSLAASVSSAKRTMRRLGSFLGDVAKSGFEGALKENGLEDLLGQGPEAVLLGIADLICGEASTHDEVDARHAAMEVFNRMLDEVRTEEELAALIEGKANRDGVVELFEQFTTQFVYEKTIRELGERAESAPVDAPTRRRRTEEILDYVQSRVRLEVVMIPDIATFDFNGRDGADVVNRVIQDTYEVFIL
jgi:hypothetical protein